MSHTWRTLCAMMSAGGTTRWLWVTARVGFRQQMSYRKAMMIGVGASVAFAAIRLLAVHGLYQGHDVVGGLNYEQMVAWAVFAGTLFTIVWVPWLYDFPEAIRTGAVVSDLLRPVNPFALQLTHQSGRLAALILVRVAPVVLAASIVLPMPAPDGASGWMLFVASLLLLAISSAAYAYLLGAVAFFTSDYHVWHAFSFYGIQLVGGVFVPLEFIPGVLGTIVRWGPGMAFLAAPTRIVNDIAPVQTLAIQLAWSIVFCIAAYFAMHFGRKRLVSFGG